MKIVSEYIESRVVRAERFELVDKRGRVRAVLGFERDVPALALYDENGGLQASLSGLIPSLDLYSSGGVHATLGATPDGADLILKEPHGGEIHLLTTYLIANLSIKGDGGNEATMGIINGAPSLRLDALLGKSHAWLTDHRLSLFDNEGNEVWNAP